MTLEENITVIINKLKTMSGKMLSFEKRLKKIEEQDGDVVKSISQIYDRIARLEDGLATVEQKEHEGGFVTEGAWFPNKKFLGWYNGSFAPSEDDGEEIPEELQQEEEEEVQEATKDEVSPETLEKLEEVTKNG